MENGLEILPELNLLHVDPPRRQILLRMEDGLVDAEIGVPLRVFPDQVFAFVDKVRVEVGSRDIPEDLTEEHESVLGDVAAEVLHRLVHVGGDQLCGRIPEQHHVV